MQSISPQRLAEEAEIDSARLYPWKMFVLRNPRAVASGNPRHSGGKAVWGLVLCVASALTGVTASAQQQAPPPSQQPPAHQQQYPEFPAGAGRDTFLRVCSQCHSPDNVIANRQNRQGWEDTITKMAGLGASASDEEFTAILDYLTKNFPPAPANKINVNKATAAELKSGLALPQTEADAIVEYREKNGDFKSIDDLKKVPGLDAEKLDAKKDQLTF